MFNDADVGADSQTSTGAYVERNRPKPPASPYMAPGANIQDFGGYSPDGAQPPPDSPVYTPYDAPAAPGTVRMGNEASDAPGPSPSFAGPGWGKWSSYQDEGVPAPPSTEAIQAPSLREPRRDAVSAIGRALMTSPHAIGRFLGGVLNSGQMNDEASNQTAMDLFKAKIAEANQRSLGETRSSMELLREAMARRAEAQAEREVQKPITPPITPDYRTIEKMVDGKRRLFQYDSHNPDATMKDIGEAPPKEFAPQRDLQPKEPSFEKETYDEWRNTQKAAGKPSDRMTFAKEKAHTTATGQASSAKISQDIADLDTNIEMAGSVRQLANVIKDKHPNQLEGKASALYNRGKYKLGFTPSEEYQQMIPLVNALKAYVTGPLLRGIRNQVFVKAIWEHVPQADDTPQLMIEKLDVLEDLMRQARSEKAGAAEIEQRPDATGGVPVPGLSNPPQRGPGSAPKGGLDLSQFDKK